MIIIRQKSSSVIPVQILFYLTPEKLKRKNGENGFGRISETFSRNQLEKPFLGWKITTFWKGDMMAFGENFLCAVPIKKTKNEDWNSFSRTISKKMVYQWGNQNLYGCEMLLQARFTMVSQQPGLKDSRLELKKEKGIKSEREML